MLYHYTDRLTAADIRRDGAIRARRMTLHRDLLGQDAGFTTAPLVWLTINPILDMTIVGKMIGGGWPKTLVGDLCRIVLPRDYCERGLGDYCDEIGMDPFWWQMVVQTGQMVGSDYTTWRLVTQDIPAADWLAVETLTGFDAATTQWSRD